MGSPLNFGVHQSGSHGGPVFVLLHGIGVSHRYFSRLSRVLKDAGRVISLDLPGFGRTATPSSALSVERYARAIALVLDTLGVSHCVVVGQSMGTQFAVDLARQRPDLVSDLVLIGPVVDPRRRTVVEQSLALARDTLGEPLSANIVVFTDYLRCGFRWYIKELGPMLAYPIEERILTVSQPVLVLRGRSDPIAKEDWCRALAGAAPAGSLSSADGNHLVHYTAAPEVAAMIVRFVVERDAL